MKKFKLKSLMTLVLTTALSLSVSTFANAEVQTERLKGNNRYETAKEIAMKFEKSDFAILVNGQNYPDALAATPLAKKYNAPILLTTKNELPIQTKEVINNLEVTNIIVIGGTGVVTDNVTTELQKENIKVERISGDNRYETSYNVAKKVGMDNGIFVTTGEGFADALGVGSIAASKNMPIVLTNKNDSNHVIDDVISSANPNKSYMIGGEGVISNEVLNKLPNAERIQGKNRYETNENLIEKFRNELDMDNVFLTSGQNFPDALSGSALASKTNSPMILANQEPSKSIRKITSNSEKMYVLGGEGAISKVLEDIFKGNKIDELKVTYLNVGQGDCILVQNGEHNMLIDAGSNETEGKVKEFLDNKGIKKFDIVVASVVDEGHIGGMDNIIRNYEIDKFYYTPYKTIQKQDVYRDMIDELYENKVDNTTVIEKSITEREDLYLGNAKIDTLYAPWFVDDANNSSVITRISHGDNKYLFTGNAAEKSEENLSIFNNDYVNIEANVLKVANYGKSTSSCAKVLDLIQPEYAIISSKEEPNQQVIDKLHQRNVETHKTNTEGNIVSISDGQFIEFTTEN